jgi:hypothetical protein
LVHALGYMHYVTSWTLAELAQLFVQALDHFKFFLDSSCKAVPLRTVLICPLLCLFEVILI